MCVRMHACTHARAEGGEGRGGERSTGEGMEWMDGWMDGWMRIQCAYKHTDMHIYIYTHTTVYTYICIYIYIYIYIYPSLYLEMKTTLEIQVSLHPQLRELRLARLRKLVEPPEWE